MNVFVKKKTQIMRCLKCIINLSKKKCIINSEYSKLRFVDAKLNKEKIHLNILSKKKKHLKIIMKM